MKNIVFTTFVFIAIFLNTNFGRSFGISHVLITVLSPLAIYCLWLLSEKGIKKNSVSKTTFSIILISLLIFLYKASIDQFLLRDITTLAILPSIFILAFERLTFAQKEILRKILVLLFLFECGVAFYERFTLQILFVAEDSFTMLSPSGEIWSFRASGLFGHPILNSMITSLMMLFIMLSDMNTSKKLFLFSIGFVALLCFNSRAGIVLIIILSAPLIFRMTKKEKLTSRLLIFFLLSIAIVLSIWVMLNTNLGGRLLGLYENNSGFFQDESAQTRLETIYIFMELIDKEVLWNGIEDYSWLNMYDRGYIIENGYVAFLLKYGIIFGSVFLFFLIRLHFKLLKQYPKFERAILLIGFYGFAFTNPHLANGTVWLLFIYSYYGFSPKSSLTDTFTCQLSETSADKN